MTRVIDGVIAEDGSCGAVTIELHPVYVDVALIGEPGSSLVKAGFEELCWFHPYTGGPPRRCSHPEGGRTFLMR